MSSTQKPGDEHRSLPDDIALAAGMPRGHLSEGSLHDVPSPGSHHTGTQTHSIYTMEGGHAGSTADEVKARANDLRDRAAETAGDVRDQVSDKVQNLRERASDVYDDARNWASDTHQEGRRRINEFSERSGGRLRDGRSAVEDFVSENPLLVGVVGLAAGLLIGALLPRTRTEDENVGPWADEVRDQGLRYARDVTHRGREFVATALDPENLNAAVQRATGNEQPDVGAPTESSPVSSATRPH